MIHPLMLLALFGVTLAHAQDKAPSDIDLRVSAMAQYYESQLAQATRNGATLAAELAATQAKLKAAEAKECKPEAKKDEKR